MIKGLKAVARERAHMERDRIVLSTMIDDMALSEAFLELDPEGELDKPSYNPQYDNNKDDEVNRLIDQIPVPDINDIETSDIDTIMQSEESMEIDDMLAIQDAVD